MEFYGLDDYKRYRAFTCLDEQGHVLRRGRVGNSSKELGTGSQRDFRPSGGRSDDFRGAFAGGMSIGTVNSTGRAMSRVSIGCIRQSRLWIRAECRARSLLIEELAVDRVH